MSDSINETIPSDEPTKQEKSLQNIESMCNEIAVRQFEQDNNNEEIMEKMKELAEKQESQNEINEKILENQDKILNEIEAMRKFKDRKIRQERVKIRDLDDNTNDYMKKFVIKHTFKNVIKNNQYDEEVSPKVEHFGVEWSIKVERRGEHLSCFLECLEDFDEGEKRIKTKFEMKFLYKHGLFEQRETAVYFGRNKNDYTTYGWNKFVKLKEAQKNLAVKNELTVRCNVTIKWMYGIYKDPLIDFEEETKECSDVMLRVEKKPFYVSKLFLSAQSTYFRKLFLQPSRLIDSEIKLNGIDEDDFQNYLEVIYGKSAIDEQTVEGILYISVICETPIVFRKCEEFLLTSDNLLNKKFELALKFNMMELKEKCFAELKSSRKVRDMISGDFRDLDYSVLAVLFEKMISFV